MKVKRNSRSFFMLAAYLVFIARLEELSPEQLDKNFEQ